MRLGKRGALRTLQQQLVLAAVVVAATQSIRNMGQHGDHHPAISVKFDRPALLTTHNSTTCEAGLEVRAWIDGLIANFEYLVMVALQPSADGSPERVWQQRVYLMDSDSTSFEVKAMMGRPDESAQHRVAVWVLDAYEGLDIDQRKLAVRDGTFNSVRAPGKEIVVSAF